jgi:hypothetical protein
MKKLFFYSMFLIAVSSATAQKVTIAWGEEGKKELTFWNFLKGQGTDMIKLCLDAKLFKKKVTPVLTRYDDKLTVQAESAISVDEDNIVFNNLFSVKGKIFLITTQYDKETKTTTYFAQAMNIQTLNPEGKVINLGAFDAVKKSSQSSVGFELSADSTKVLMFGTAPYDKKANQKYYMAVLDNNMKKLWDKSVELPYLDKYITLQDELVTNDGRVVVMLKHYDQEVTKETVKVDGNKVPSYKTKMLLYDQANDKPVEYLLDLNDKFVHSLQLVSDNTADIVLFGLYKEKHDGHITGFFTATFDKKTNKTSVTNLNKFPDDLVAQIRIDKQGSDKEKDPGLDGSFKLRGVEERANGSKDFVLEYYSEIFYPGSYTFGGLNGGSSYTPPHWDYNYGDIIDINLQKNGKTIIGRIPKMQESTNVNAFSNFKLLPYKDKLLVFYNDDDDNINRDINKKPDALSRFNKSDFVMGTFDSNGNVTRDILFKNKDNKLTTATRECVQLDKNRIGLYAQKFAGMFSAAKDMVGIMTIE